MKKKSMGILYPREKVKKIITMTKLCLFFVVFSLQLHANVFSQQERISLRLENVSAKKLFIEIEKVSDFAFIYKENDVKLIDDLSVNFINAEIKKILDYCFEGTNIGYEILDSHIVIKRNKEKVVEQNDKKEIKGIVVDEKNVPLPGVTVMVKGTSSGTATNMNGEFTLKVKKGDILSISFIGMKPQEIVINDFNKKINVVLKENRVSVEEVIVTGYQKVDRKLFTGSAAKLSAEKAKVGGTVDVGRMLEGKVAGVSVQNVSGTFGAAPKIRVRGASSIYGDTKPLWVVDGIVLEDVVDISPDELSSGDAKTLISSSVAGLNADDIANFQILKDASATALYGARAMNGVIVITTKKGRSGENSINVSSEFTVKIKPSYADYDIMNSQEQMSMFREMERKGWMSHSDMMRSKDGGVYFKMYEAINTYHKGKNPGEGYYELENSPQAMAEYLRKYEKINTNWFDILFRNSLQQNHSISFSGGSEKSRFYVSTSLLHDSGWTIADNVDRYTLNMRGDFDITDKLKVGLQTKGSVRNQKTPGTFDRTNDVVNGTFSREFDINPFSYALNTSRTIAPYDSKGNLEWVRMNYAPFNILNEYDNNYIDLNMVDLSLQLNLDYNFNKNLSYKFAGSMRYVKTTREHMVKEGSNVVKAYRAGVDDATISEMNRYLWKDPEDPNAYPVSVLPHGGLYNREDNMLVNYYFRNVINYNKTFNDKHSLNILVGQELKYVDRKTSFSNGYGIQFGKGNVVYTDPNIIKSTVQGGFNYFGLEMNYDRFVAAFANVGFSWGGKYTINGTARIDGSNKLGESKDARYLPTWNISGKWNIMEEPWFQDSEWLSTLAVRGTYGLTASMGRATNSKIILRNDVTVAPFASEKQNRMYVDALENSELTWEKQYETNIGFDLGIFNNRISFQADMYKRNGFDLIAYIRTSGIGGEGWKMANYADMTSKGVEFTLNTRNIVSKDFSWVTNITYAYNSNTITNLKNKPKLYNLIRAEGGAIEGGSVRGLYSIKFAGLDENGLPQFYDNEGDIVNEINFQSKDISNLKYEGSVDPHVTGGMSNMFKYKNFKLNVFCTYQFGNVIRLYPSFHASYSDMDAITKDMKDRWMVKGEENITEIPTLVSKRLYDTYKGNIEAVYNCYNYSDRRVAKGDFIRLKEVSLEYSLSKDFVEKIGFKKASLKLQSSNLWLLYSDKKLNGQDPEFFGTGGVAMPVPKQTTFTLKLGF